MSLFSLKFLALIPYLAIPSSQSLGMGAVGTKGLGPRPSISTYQMGDLSKHSGSLSILSLFWTVFCMICPSRVSMEYV